MKLNRLLIALGAVVVMSGRADAKLLELTAQADSGYSLGFGTADFDTDKDFFNVQKGGLFGIKLGIEVVLPELTIEHQQFYTPDGLKGSWTQFLLGMDVDFAVSQDQKWVCTFGGGVGYGIGTLQSVDPPLDKAQIETRGFVGQVELDLDYKLNKDFRIGVALPVGYHYMFQNDGADNDPTGQSQGIHVSTLLTFKFQHAF